MKRAFFNFDDASLDEFVEMRKTLKEGDNIKINDEHFTVVKRSSFSPSRVIAIGPEVVYARPFGTLTETVMTDVYLLQLNYHRPISIAISPKSPR